MQLFLKRLRKQTGRKSIKYYYCGEYGGISYRPHYHAIIFDVTCDEIESAWKVDGIPIGYCHFGDVSGSSIAYTAKYMAKPSRIPLHEFDDRIPEFSLMSKGMGLNYLSPQVIDWHVANRNSYVLREGGYKLALPRYYSQRLFTDADREAMGAASTARYSDVFNSDVKSIMNELSMTESDAVHEYYRRNYFAVRAASHSFNKSNKRNSI